MRSPIPQIVRHRTLAHHVEPPRPRRGGRSPPGLANPVAVFASRRDLADPDRAAEPRRGQHPGPDRRRPALGIVGGGARGTPRPSPTPRPRRGTCAAPPSPPPKLRRRRAGRWAGTRRRDTCAAPSPSGIPDRTPNARASYDAVATTCRGRLGLPSPPTTTGRPASSGRRRTSTAARNWSRSTCSTQSAMSPTYALEMTHSSTGDERRRRPSTRWCATPNRGSRRSASSSCRPRSRLAT